MSYKTSDIFGEPIEYQTGDSAGKDKVYMSMGRAVA
jgi:hypothetical protein